MISFSQQEVLEVLQEKTYLRVVAKIEEIKRRHQNAPTTTFLGEV